MIEIEIDGKKVPAESGEMIIEVADRVGVYIPRFCYHKKLSIAANCRMCLVEVEKAPKPLPACATPVSDGMKVLTQSKATMESQRIVMEFLLINHPLDCPICDQGGECELQDIAMGFGEGVSRYNQGKRSIYDKNLGPLIESEMTRCIHCTRCVRFGEEVAGIRELGLTNRGEWSEIGPYISHAMQSEVSGNIIDLCPVGALTSKPYRYSARAWELTQHQSIAPHDCLGSNIYVHTRGKEFNNQSDVMRVLPRENESINETWISDRDRFSYTALAHSDRFTQPMVKQNGQWKTMDWHNALLFVTDRLKTVLDSVGPDAVAGLLAPHSTTEEMYLFQKLLRAMGVLHIDHRCRQWDFSSQAQAPLFPGLNMPIHELDIQQAVLLIGSDIHREQPIAGVRLRKAALRGAYIASINCQDYSDRFEWSQKQIVAQHDMLDRVAAVAKALFELIGESVPSQLSAVLVDENAKILAKNLHAAEKSSVILGAVAISHPDYGQLQALVDLIGELSESTIGTLTQGPNTAGAWLSGVLPHRGPAGALVSAGQDVRALFEQEKQAYFLFNVEPEFDCLSAPAALSALQKAGLVVMMTPLKSEAMLKYADVLLPIVPFSETAGTFINAAGQWQSFRPVTVPKGEARPGWKVLRVIANLLELPGFDYHSSEQVRDELNALVSEAPALSDQIELLPLRVKHPDISLQFEWPMQAVDPLVRRAEAFGQTLPGKMRLLRISSVDAERLQVKQGEYLQVSQGQHTRSFPVIIDAGLPAGQAVIALGIASHSGFGAHDGGLVLRREAQHA